jgi:hypothetical protein
MSWIREEEKLLKLHHNHQREVMESIDCYFAYMNKHSYIEHVTKESVAVYDGVISGERVLQMIERKKVSKPNAKYMFKDSCLFNVDLEPDQIPMYSQDTVAERFLVKLPLLDDIRIAPSIFVFHDINAIYFIFQEIEMDSVVPIKSALKNGQSQKVTKRVSYSNNKTHKARNLRFPATLPLAVNDDRSSSSKLSGR